MNEKIPAKDIFFPKMKRKINGKYFFESSF